MADRTVDTLGGNRRTMRDCVALSVLPGLWQGLGPRPLSESVVDVLWSTLELEHVQLRLELASAEGTTEIARARGDAASVQSAALAEILAWEDDGARMRPNPFEVCGLRVARWPVEWRGGRMVIGVARADEGFPAPHERMVVSVVGNYAKAALQYGLREGSAPAGDEPDPPSRSEPPARRGLAPWQITRVTAFMCDHLDQEIGLDELAAVVNLSRFHFCRAFRLATGSTPHEWFIAERMRLARSLLANPSANIAQIALTVGYKTPSAFSAVFRRVSGMTPSEYRRQQWPTIGPAAQ